MSQMPIASVLHLDRRAAKALRISDVYSLHRVVYSLFEDVRSDEQKLASQTSGIVWADQGGDFKGRRILLLSDRQPASSVEGQYGEVVSKEISGEFLLHQRYRFSVTVNPVRRDSASRKLLPVKGRESIAAWFRERAERSWGFDVQSDNLQVDSVDVLQFNDKAQRPITLAQAHLQGVLNVCNRDQFQKSFCRGIGRGRAFGCGLLQIAPLMDNPFE
tara:strand:- start:3394 stop:4044 length:651 start_codon:yes stop_codon:yes gene_type:complete